MPQSRSDAFPIGASVTLDQLDADLHQTAAILRATEPISWVPAINGWLITGYRIADRVLRDNVTFTVDDPRFTTGQVLGPSMLSTDGPAHERHRQAFERPFRKSATELNYETEVQRIAYRRVGDLARHERADLLAELAGPLAVEVITSVLGLAYIRAETVADWYRSFVEAVTELSDGRSIPPEGQLAADALRQSVAQTIRLAQPSMLTEAAWNFDLNNDEIASNVGVIMFGAIETSEGMTANALAHLLGDIERLAAVRGNRKLVDSVIEESLRFEPAAAVIDRYATSRSVIGGADIKAGDFVQISIAGANRDPGVFAEPDVFDLNRRNSNAHLSFVKGPHACIGLHLAKAETRAAINAVLDLLPDVHLSAAAVPVGRIFRKPTAVPVEWRVV